MFEKPSRYFDSNIECSSSWTQARCFMARQRPQRRARLTDACKAAAHSPFMLYGQPSFILFQVQLIYGCYTVDFMYALRAAGFF
jgi:hypothetical protein